MFGDGQVGLVAQDSAPRPGRVRQARPRGHTGYDLFYGKELSVIGCRNYTRADFANAVALLTAGSVDPRLPTASHPLDEFDLAVAALRGHPERNLEVVLTPSREAV